MCSIYNIIWGAYFEYHWYRPSEVCLWKPCSCYFHWSCLGFLVNFSFFTRSTLLSNYSCSYNFLSSRSSRPEGLMLLSNIFIFIDAFPGSMLFSSAPSGRLALRYAWKDKMKEPEEIQCGHWKLPGNIFLKRWPVTKIIALVARYYLDIFGCPIVSIPKICAQLCHVAHFCVRNQSITSRSSRPEGRMLLSNIFI